MKTCLSVFLVTACLGILGCSATPSKPDASEATRKADEKWKNQAADSSSEADVLLDVRKCALDFVRSEYPSSNLKGSAIAQSTGTFYVVRVDIVESNKERVIDTVVQRFYPLTGDPYWVCTRMNVDMRNAGLAEAIKNAGNSSADDDRTQDSIADGSAGDED